MYTPHQLLLMASFPDHPGNDTRLFMGGKLMGSWRHRGEATHV